MLKCLLFLNLNNFLIAYKNSGTVCNRDGRCDTETRERKSEELSHFLLSQCNASYLQAYVFVIYVFFFNDAEQEYSEWKRSF